jgi:hypothetical protein
MRSTAPSSEIDLLARILAVLCTAMAETPERIEMASGAGPPGTLSGTRLGLGTRWRVSH